MKQTNQHRQLQPEDRMTMASMRQQGFSTPGRGPGAGPQSFATIPRELGRDTLAALPCDSHTAQGACASRRVASRPVGKLDFNGVGWSAVRTLLDWKWSPQRVRSKSTAP